MCPELAATYHQQFLILSNEADLHNRASFYSISNYLQEAARTHAMHLGWGIEFLREKNMFWVLTRMEIKMDEFPAPGSFIDVETWPKSTDRLFALRDFLISANGKTIGRATSSWALLQLPHRRPMLLQDMGDIMHMLKNKHAIEQPAAKIAATVPGSEDFKRLVQYSDLDLNAHVNNTRYLTWMLDTLPLDYHHKYAPFSASLNYLAEVFAEQTVRIKRQQTAPHVWLFGICNEKNEDLFRGILSFQPVK